MSSKVSSGLPRLPKKRKLPRRRRARNQSTRYHVSHYFLLIPRVQLQTCLLAEAVLGPSTWLLMPLLMPASILLSQRETTIKTLATTLPLLPKRPSPSEPPPLLTLALTSPTTARASISSL